MELTQLLIKEAQFFADESTKEAQLQGIRDNLPQAHATVHRNWETQKTFDERENLYNHHKCLIFACINYTSMPIKLKRNKPQYPI